MVKIRLMGTLEDLERFVADLSTHYHLLEVSEPYKNRGNSELYRLYVTVQSL